MLEEKDVSTVMCGEYLPSVTLALEIRLSHKLPDLYAKCLPGKRSLTPNPYGQMSTQRQGSHGDGKEQSIMNVSFHP